MDPDRQSKLVMYSLGIVMEDKARGSDKIKVYPVEEFPQIDGKIAEFKPTYKITAPNIKGATKAVDLQGDAIIIANWLPLGNSNRNTSPDVIKNETVAIYRYADSDEYHWDTVFREPLIRRLETVCWMFGDIPTGLKAFDKSSSYWCEVSTHDQHIHIHTVKTNKEPFIYDIKLDTKNGNLTIMDDIGNKIYLDSRAHQIKLINTEGAYYDMIKENITINAPKTIKNICQDFIIEASSSVTHKTPQTTLTGKLTVGGATTLSGATTLQSGLTSSGSMDISGTVRANNFIET
jgi:phage baseplate assembly protein gpV